MAVFVENNSSAVKCIEENLQKTKLFSQATVQALDVITAIRRLDGEDSFSIIYMDPPYSGGFEESVLTELSKTSLVNEDTIIIIEAAIDKKLPFITSLGYEITREKCYKTNKHIFIKFIGEK